MPDTPEHSPEQPTSAIDRIVSIMKGKDIDKYQIVFEGLAPKLKALRTKYRQLNLPLNPMDLSRKLHACIGSGVNEETHRSSFAQLQETLGSAEAVEALVREIDTELEKIAEEVMRELPQ